MRHTTVNALNALVRRAYAHVRRSNGGATGIGARRDAPCRRGLRRRFSLEPLETRSLLSAGPLVISEFMAANDATLADEDGQFSDWIEIHNPTDGPVDLAGWSLTDDGVNHWRFPTMTLDAGQYLVVFASGNNRAVAGEPLHTDFQLSAGGEYLGLWYDNGTQAAFEYAPEYPRQQDDVSYGFASDENTQGYFTLPTPGGPNTVEPIIDPDRQIVINEIMYHPESENDAEEFIELFNRGLGPVNLAGWRFDAGVGFVFPDVTMQPGDYLVVAADPDVFAATYPGAPAPLGPWEGRLSNRTEQIELSSAAGARMDRVEYADQGEWAVRTEGPDDRGYTGWIWVAEHDGGGKSLELISTSMSNRSGQNWTSSTPDGGTPGAVNSTASADIAPLVRNVEHNPPIPRSGETVTVTADVDDEITAGLTVTLRWQADGAGSFVGIAMRDDGQNGDAEAGDGTFTAALPAQADGTVVEFYVEAFDAGGNRRVWPAPAEFDGADGTAGPKALYQVDDSFDPDMAWTPGSQPYYRIIMTPEENDEFLNINRQSNAQMNATFVAVDGTGIDVRHNAGVRVRGAGSRSRTPVGMRLSFPHDAPWHGVRQINLNAQYTYLQTLGSAMFRLAGLPAAEAQPVRVRLNGVDHALSGSKQYGSYVQVEVINSDFAANHVPGDPDGNVYKKSRPATQWNYRDGDVGRYLSDGWGKQTNSAENDWSDLDGWLRVMDDPSSPTFFEDLKQRINIDQWPRWFALMTLMNNRETSLSNGTEEDYQMYRGIDDTRFILLPHDLDTIFGLGDTPTSASATIFQALDPSFRTRSDPALQAKLNALFREPEFISRFYTQLLELLDTVFAPEAFNATVDQIVGGWIPEGTIDAVKQFMVERAASVRSQIPLEFTAGTDLPVADGFPQSTVPSATITGTADATRTRSVLVGGRPAEWSPFDGTWAYNGDAAPPEGATQTLLPRGSEWRYLDDGSDGGTAWRTPEFDDSSWASGPAQLGYGDGDEATEINGGPGGDRFPTSYFRTEFYVGDPAEVANLLVRLLRDDGAVVYLNGQELLRDYMPDGDVAFDTWARSLPGGLENEFAEFLLGPELLVAGRNVLAAEVHQSAPSSSDVSFDLQLEAILAESVLAAKGSRWLYNDFREDLGTDWRAAEFDDSAWPAGYAQLGGGDGDEVTVVGLGPAGDRTPTVYFRTEFTIADPTRYGQLTLQLLRDDGAVVYLNGQEAARSNMPAGEVAYATTALQNAGGSNETTFQELPIDASLLVPGRNVLAVEVHQSNSTSGDLGFDLGLSGQFTDPEPTDDLLPGINRVLAEAFDGPGGTGNLIDSQTLDVWYDDGSMADVSGTIDADTLWIAAEGPYYVTGPMTIAAGKTLTIEPGTTVFFDAGTGITVNGRLVAEGTEFARIRLTRLPGTNGAWDGIQLIDSPTDNRLAFIDMNYADARGDSIYVVRSEVAIDNATWAGTARTVLELSNSSAIVSRSVFPSIDNNETVHGSGIPADGYLIFDGNTFGTTTGYSDVIDFTGGKRPDAVLQVLNNVFLGGSDDGLDLDGTDAHIEGNVFMRFRQDVPRDSSANAIATGKDGANASNLMVVRNVFFDNDHDVLLKEGSSMTAQNNTFIGATIASINFDERNRPVVPGAGAVLENNIFRDVAALFQNEVSQGGEPDPTIVLNNSVVPAAWVAAGQGNTEEDPRLAASPDGYTYTLGPGSPALGRGTDGLDMGADVPGGVSFVIQPPAITAADSAVLRVAGPGVTRFKYRVNGGSWSAERPILLPIQLTSLAAGQYTVEAVGRNSAGDWQPDDQAAVSRTWTVDPALTRVVINEVLAVNPSAVEHEGTYPDLIELYNAGAGVVDLGGYGLSDRPDNPLNYVFPPGTNLAPGEYLVLYADDNFAASGIHAGFSLDGDGEGVYLFDAAANLLDSIEFGIQLPDLSIGRIGHDGAWTLTEPTFGQSTFGQSNVAARSGDANRLSINEWLAQGDYLLVDDFIELYNDDPLPVPLGGLILAENPGAFMNAHAIAPLSYIAGESTVALVADGRPQAGADHVGFKVSSHHEVLGLLDTEGNEIDKIISYSQTADVSLGRQPNGGESLAFFDLPTPGADNPEPGDTLRVFDFSGDWAYEQSGTDLGTAWRTVGYNDASWSTGPGVLGRESATLAEPIRTNLTLGPMTFYFRKHFTLDADPSKVRLQLQTLLDDGAVVYLNGVEVLRVRIADGTVAYDTAAGSASDNANLEGPFDLPTGSLVRGDNVLAVEVHQSSAGSSDVVFGTQLDATINANNPAIDRAWQLIGSLRVTEIMYHAPFGASQEYIELRNIGTAPLNLAGVRISGGIDFTFPAMLLVPNRYVVVADDVAAFRARYGPDALLAGQYSGSLSNGGETIVLQLPNPLDAAIMRFDYNDWYVETDGGGYSLSVTDADADLRAWNDKEHWELGDLGGSPGHEDGLVFPPRVTVDPLVTSDSRPQLTGTVNEPDATVRVSVGGRTYTATNMGNGTWILPDNSMPTALDEGYHDVSAIATSVATQLVGNDTTVDELLINARQPSAIIDWVSPDPRTVPLSRMTIMFSEPVSGFDVNDLVLSRDGGPNLLDGAVTLATGNDAVWTLGNLDHLTGEPGEYTLTLAAGGSGIVDVADSPLAADATRSWTMMGKPYTNPDDPVDVDDDGRIAPIDSLLIINNLNSFGARPLPAVPTGDLIPPPYLDVNGDGYLSPIDALWVINFLNARARSEAEPFAAIDRVMGVVGDSDGAVNAPRAAWVLVENLNVSSSADQPVSERGANGLIEFERPLSLEIGHDEFPFKLPVASKRIRRTSLR